MELKKYLKEVAYLTPSNIEGVDCDQYLSKFDDSYITLVGMEENVKYLADHEITKELTHGVGFSPKDNKWYGWSHRAIYGFTIGSTCEKGGCHYTASTPEQLIDDHANFYADISVESAEMHRAECQILDDRSGIRILHTPVKISMVDKESDLDDLLNGDACPEDFEKVNLFENDFSTIKCGRGEWVAETLEDAKQMAIDFNKGVS